MLTSTPSDELVAAIDGEKWEQVTRLLETHGERLLLDGEDRLEGWLAALPEDYATRNARLAMLYAWVLVYKQRYQEALRYLSKAERVVQQRRFKAQSAKDEAESHALKEFEHELNAIRLHLKAVSDERVALPENVEEIMLPASSDHPVWRASALVTFGRTRYLSGDLEGAGGDLDTAHTLASLAGGPRAAEVALNALAWRGRVAEEAGDLTKARAAYDRQHEMGDLHDAAVGHARLALLRLDLKAAGELLTGLEGLKSKAASPPSIYELLLGEPSTRAWWHALEGRFEEAELLLRGIEPQLKGSKMRWPAVSLDIMRARFALWQGDLNWAKRWLQQRSVRRHQPVLKSPVMMRANGMAAQARVALGEYERAQQEAHEVGLYAAEQKMSPLLIRSLFVESLAWWGLEKEEAARQTFERAQALSVETGVFEGYRIPGLDALAEALGLSLKVSKRPSVGPGAAAVAPEKAAELAEKVAPKKKEGGAEDKAPAEAQEAEAEG